MRTSRRHPGLSEVAVQGGEPLVDGGISPAPHPRDVLTLKQGACLGLKFESHELWEKVKKKKILKQGVEVWPGSGEGGGGCVAWWQPEQ